MGKNTTKYSRKYYQDHKEQIKAYAKQYRQDHPEQIKAYAKQYRQDHRKQLVKYSRKYYQDHKEQFKLYSRKLERNWRKSHPSRKPPRAVNIRRMTLGEILEFNGRRINRRRRGEKLRAAANARYELHNPGGTPSATP